jgi:UDP-N-acetylmuramate dehydrogenase
VLEISLKSAMNWRKNLKGRFKTGEPLKKHTTFKIGGPAEFFAEPKDLADLKLLLNLAKKKKLRPLIIGAGSNILVGDRGVKALVIKLNSPFFKEISFKGNTLKAGSGLALGRLIASARKQRLGGLEFLGGIPGSVGGALAMNAGAWMRSILEFVENVRVMDYNGRKKNIPKQKIKYGYRKSSLAKYIILGATFKLKRVSPAIINAALKQYLKRRRNSQESSCPNAGCIFKNPPGESAGRLIDLCGLKGRSCAGALISPKHANFILNAKNARAADVLQLISLIKRRVKNKFNVELHPEIKIW